MKRQEVPALREREGRDHILRIEGAQPELEGGIGGQGRAQCTNEKTELPDQQAYNGPRVPGRKLTTTPRCLPAAAHQLHHGMHRR